jgi:two-component system response regulator (stage 0 sporulation protein A)
MKTQRLLVADSSVAFSCALSEKLAGAFELRICADGLQAREQLDKFSPDVLVVDMTLPGLDGISVLKAAGTMRKRPAMLALTRFCSPFIENALGELGVDYLMYKPCDMTALTERIYDLMGSHVVIPLVQTNTAAGNVLAALGITLNRKGYACTMDALELLRENMGLSMTKELYPMIAKRQRCSAASVERAIRGAVETAWLRRDEKIWRQYFTPSREGFVPKPTNAVFLRTLAERLERQNCSGGFMKR